MLVGINWRGFGRRKKWGGKFVLRGEIWRWDLCWEEDLCLCGIFLGGGFVVRGWDLGGMRGFVFRRDFLFCGGG